MRALVSEIKVIRAIMDLKAFKSVWPRSLLKKIFRHGVEEIAGTESQSLLAALSIEIISYFMILYQNKLLTKMIYRYRSLNNHNLIEGLI